MGEREREFGGELRRRRMEAGLSLADLGKLLHYSKGHLSKIENGSKSPSPELARMSDAALGADGALLALAPVHPPESPLPEAEPDNDEVWLMNLSDSGASWFHPLSQRDALAMTTFSTMGFDVSPQGLAATAGEPTALKVLREFYDQFRSLGQTASPGAVLPSVISQTHVLRQLSAHAPAELRDGFLVLGARFAEYAGWMWQESGNEQAALWWTDLATQMAAAGNDHDLAVYALVRRALVTLYREDAAQTIRLARQAQVSPQVPRRIRGLAAQREAQGHALAGDHDNCMASLEVARELLDGASAPGQAPVLGTVNLPDPAAMVTGWCLYELGRPRQASGILDAEVARIRPQALRTRARYGARQALTHAAAGEIEHACALVHNLLPLADVVSSATITTDLRRLARMLARWHTDPMVREVYPALTRALSSPNI